jgi:hypothetical protein
MKLRTCLGIISIIALSAGCELIDSDNNDADGQYLLSEIGSSSLPAILVDNGASQIWVISSELVIAGGRYTSRLTIASDVNDSSSYQQINENGRVTHHRQSLTLTADSDGRTSTLTVVDRTTLRRLSDMGKILIYRRPFNVQHT